MSKQYHVNVSVTRTKTEKHCRFCGQNTRILY